MRPRNKARFAPAALAAGLLFFPPVHDPAHLAAAYLVRAQKPSGLFRYEYDFMRAADSPKDSIVRQAGAGYALAEYYAHARDAGVRGAIASALRAYAARSIPFGGGRLVSADGGAAGARGGATALALLAEMQLARASGERRFAGDRRRWLRGLLALRRPGGGFRKTAAEGAESDYFNGEIWLALGYAERRFPGHAGVRGTLEAVDAHFLARYAAAPTVRFYHWGAMAALERYRATGQRRFAAFAVRQTAAFLDRLRPRVSESVNTCYAAEGLISAHALGEAGGMEPRLRARLAERIRAEMEKNAAFQIELFQWTLPTARGPYLFSPGLPDFAGAFVSGTRRPRARVDYTQHCLSALVKYERFGPAP